MEILSGCLGALISAVATIVTTIIILKGKKKKNSLDRNIVKIAKNLDSIKIKRLTSLRKFSEGKTIKNSRTEDKDMILISIYKMMAIDKLVNVIERDNNEIVITLTKLGWKVAAAVDSLC